jgi:hypothetical protein
MSWEVEEMSMSLPVVDGVADITYFFLPLLTGIDAPPNSVLITRTKVESAMGHRNSF